jgi:hypothetical protein
VLPAARAGFLSKSVRMAHTTAFLFSLVTCNLYLLTDKGRGLPGHDTRQPTGTNARSPLPGAVKTAPGAGNEVSQVDGMRRLQRA